MVAIRGERGERLIRVSLKIDFGGTAGSARLVAGPGHEAALRDLSLKFASASHPAQGVVDLDLDELLTNLAVLGAWPDPAGVEWESDLARLATDVTRDAQSVAHELAAGGDGDTVHEADVEASLGPNWIGGLTDFQRRDIAKLLSLRHGANFSVPGAGKTRVGLATFQSLRTRGTVERLLIVAPKSARDSWLFENKTCLATPLRMTVFPEGSNGSSEALIVNYERLPGAVNELSKWLAARPSMLLLDEAHRMKLGPDGAYGAACLALGPRSRHRLILTGTPAPNGVRDLENLFGFVWPGQGRQTVTTAVAGGDLRDASRLLKPLYARTTKKELGLPDVTTKIIPVDMPPLHREIYDALVGQFSVRAIAEAGDFMALGRVIMYLLMAATSPALLAAGSTRYEPLAYRLEPVALAEGAALTALMRDLPSLELSPKLREAVAQVSENAREGRKTIVWSTFIRNLTTLERLLKPHKPAVVHGGTKDRDAEIERFRNDPNCKVLLSNPATLGEGISLHQECHDAIYVDRDFAAGRYLQSVDRIHRLGLAPGTETRVKVLVTRGTIDEVVAQRLQLKLDFMGTILDDPSLTELADVDEEPSLGEELSREDLKQLIAHIDAHQT
jgi:hypothetical protein